MRSVAHRLNQRNQDSPTVLVLPGASLMRIEALTSGILRVTCPGCGASHVFRPPMGPGGRLEHTAFEHEHDSCPVLIQINDALAALRRAAQGDSELLAALDELCPTAPTTISQAVSRNGH